MEKQLVFRLKSHLFALPLSSVERILNLKLVSVFQDSEDYIMGTTTYEEKELPIINLSKHFLTKELECEEESQVLVTLWKNQRIGLAVDEVMKITSFEKNQLKNKKTRSTKNESIDKQQESFISNEENYILEIESVFAMTYNEKKAVFFLNMDYLFTEKENQKVQTFIKMFMNKKI